MFSLSKWIRARREKKTEKEAQEIAKIKSSLEELVEEYIKESETLARYYQDIKAGQQFFDFMFDDPVFKKVYECVKNGTMGVLCTLGAVS